MREEAEDSLTIVGCNDDYAATACKAESLITSLRATAGNESATVEVNQNREFLIVILCRGPYIEIEAILALSWTFEHHVAKSVVLYRVVAELLCRADTLPRNNRLRSFPTQIAYRWCSKRNATEYLYTCGIDAFNDSTLHLYLWTLRHC